MYLDGADHFIKRVLKRRLTLGTRHSHVQPTTDPCTYLGFRLSRAGMAPGRAMRRRMQLKVRAAADRGPEALARSLIAYRGLMGGL